MCLRFALKKNELKTKFADKPILLAHNLNIDVTLQPSDKKAEPQPRIDPTIARASDKQLREISFVSQVDFNRICRQLDFIYVSGPLNFGFENGLIITARIVAQPDNLGNART